MITKAQIDGSATSKENMYTLLHQVLDHTAECIKFADASVSAALELKEQSS